MKQYHVSLTCNDESVHLSDPDLFSSSVALYRTILRLYETGGYTPIASSRHGRHASVTFRKQNETRIVSLEEVDS
jgi:hypothetical protein